MADPKFQILDYFRSFNFPDLQPADLQKATLAALRDSTLTELKQEIDAHWFLAPEQVQRILAEFPSFKKDTNNQQPVLEIDDVPAHITRNHVIQIFKDLQINDIVIDGNRVFVLLETFTEQQKEILEFEFQNNKIDAWGGSTISYSSKSWHELTNKINNKSSVTAVSKIEAHDEGSPEVIPTKLTSPRPEENSAVFQVTDEVEEYFHSKQEKLQNAYPQLQIPKLGTTLQESTVVRVPVPEQVTYDVIPTQTQSATLPIPNIQELIQDPLAAAAKISETFNLPQIKNFIAQDQKSNTSQILQPLATAAASVLTQATSQLSQSVVHNIETKLEQTAQSLLKSESVNLLTGFASTNNNLISEQQFEEPKLSPIPAPLETSKVPEQIWSVFFFLILLWLTFA